VTSPDGKNSHLLSIDGIRHLPTSFLSSDDEHPASIMQQMSSANFILFVIFSFLIIFCDADFYQKNATVDLAQRHKNVLIR